MKRLVLTTAALAAFLVLALTASAQVMPPGPDADCSGQTPIVAASDDAAQLDLYAAITLATAIDTTCIVLAGPRDAAIDEAQRARLDAADDGGWIIGGTVAVPPSKVAGRQMNRLAGVDRWHTMRLVERVVSDLAASRDVDIEAATAATARTPAATSAASAESFSRRADAANRGLPQQTLARLEHCDHFSLPGGGQLDRARCGTVTADDGYSVRYVVWPATVDRPDDADGDGPRGSDAPVGTPTDGPADVHSAGTLTFHFGGPGTDSRTFLPTWAVAHPDRQLLRQFDLVAVEQRGVDLQDGVDCGGDELLHRVLSGTETDLDLAADLMREWMRGCPAGRFGSLAHASDVSAVLADLGAANNVFVGFSYGTVIGALLAQHHPEAVSRVLLDSPALLWDLPDLGVYQLEAFAESLEGFFVSCDAGQCVNLQPGEARPLFRELMETFPRPGDLLYGTVLSTYSAANWFLLDSAMEAASNGDYAYFSGLADFYHRRVGESYPPSTETFYLVSCADGIDRDDPDPEATHARVLAAGPLGELSAQIEPSIAGLCDEWAGTAEPVTIDLSDTTVPLLVVASRDDPATPYNLIAPYVEELLPPAAGLVATDGFVHGLWGEPDQRCVNDVIGDFVLSGTLPASQPQDWHECG